MACPGDKDASTWDHSGLPKSFQFGAGSLGSERGIPEKAPTLHLCSHCSRALINMLGVYCHIVNTQYIYYWLFLLLSVIRFLYESAVAAIMPTICAIYKGTDVFFSEFHSSHRAIGNGSAGWIEACSPCLSFGDQ